FRGRGTVELVCRVHNLTVAHYTDPPAGKGNSFVSAIEGSQIFFQSVDAAVLMFSRVTNIPTESLILPVISTNDRLTLGCELWHLCLGWNHNTWATTNIASIGSIQPVDKKGSSIPALASRTKRIFYMSSEGRNLLHEVFPTVNPSALEQLSKGVCLVYAMGSLFTSVCPSLLVRFSILEPPNMNISNFSWFSHMNYDRIPQLYCLALGRSFSQGLVLTPKVFLLNGSHDRETSGLSISGFITAIADALNRTFRDPQNCMKNPIGSNMGTSSRYVIALLVPKDGQIPVDVQSLSKQGIFQVLLYFVLNFQAIFFVTT
ncbi:hypothetical protein C5167_034880, partial [Papaver somniferum]